MKESFLKDLIQQIIAEQAIPSLESAKRIDSASGVIAVRTETVQPEPFDTGQPGDRVRLIDLFSLAESPRLGCGVMEMTESCFDWTLRYDEIDYVIEGTLEIVVDGRKIIGQQGDTLLIPKNTCVQFSTPAFVRFLYITYPANWDQL